MCGLESLRVPLSRETMMPDTELLTRYANRRDEAAFCELVRRHLDHVYSTALRLVGRDTHLAEDVTQAVFTDLARKAGSLRDCQALRLSIGLPAASS